MNTKIFRLLLATLATGSLLPAADAGPASSNPPLLRAGERVQTAVKAAVWSAPPVAGTLNGEQSVRATGVIVSGPVRSSDAWWWEVRYDRGPRGWTAERQLLNVQGQPAPPRLVPNRPPPSRPASESFVQLAPAEGVFNRPDVILQGKVTDDVYAPLLVSFSINGTKVNLQPNGDFFFPVKLVPGTNTFTFESRTPNPRQQINEISAFLDGSVIYGSDALRAAALRTFTGGLLKTSGGDLPPLNTAGLANANDAHLFADNELFLAGDVRANENVELSAIHALFVREHNQLATAIAAANPTLSDEQVFQQARRIVVAELQVITYREFLPALLGPMAVRPYRGYNPLVNPGIATEFSTAAYRIGHTLINDDVKLLDNDARELDEPLALADAFFNPSVLKAFGPGPLLKYLSTDNAQEVDSRLVGGLRNFLFGPPGAGGFDLASLNIQRGRDHGLADYNQTRAAYGLPRVTAFAQITKDVSLQSKLASLYGNVDTIDLWIGGLCEDHAPGSSVGPTFQRIIADQFERIRDGDSNWYALKFAGPQLQEIERTRLSDIIRRNTEITKIQDNVFFFDEAMLPGLQTKPGYLPAALVKSGPVPRPASLDGKGNNASHNLWGSAGIDLMRWTHAAYGDAISTPAGAGRPSARLVSNTVADSPTSLANDRKMSDWVYGWGQFIDHDLDLSTTGDAAFDVAVPVGDPYFDPKATGTAVIYLNRSIYDSTTGFAEPKIQRKTITLVFKPVATPPPPRR